jgi:hypothetical protein
MARMDLVRVEGDHFIVAPPSKPGARVEYVVFPDAEARLRCMCAEFEEAVVEDSTYCCAHVYAVMHSKVGGVGGRHFDPTAKSVADMVMVGQLSIIRRLARAAGVDPDAECRREPRFRCATEDLSKLGAMLFINHLKSILPEGVDMGGDASE